MSKTAAATVLITGNTFPVRQKLAALGGVFNRAARGWDVPEKNADKAWALVGGKPAVTRAPADFAGFRPTGEQAALLSFVQASDKNLFIEAGAGCGKTTTALWILSHLSGKKCMLAFNRDIKADIEEKADATTEVATMNAFGFRALSAAFGKLDVDSDYAWTLFRADFGDETVSKDASYFARVKKLYDLCRSFLAASVDEALELVAGYEIDFSTTDGGDRSVAAAEYVVSLMARRADTSTPVVGIDFVDQLWLPVARGLAMPSYDVVVLDEAQDTAPVQVAMLRGCAERGARIIAVGDRRQAIYQFRGADARARSTTSSRRSTCACCR